MLKYLADAHEAVERKMDLLSESVRGVDARVETIPQITYLVQKFMAPILRGIEIDYDALADVGEVLQDDEHGDVGDGLGGQNYNYKNADKIRYIKWAREGKIAVSKEQKVLVERLVTTAKHLCKIVYCDSIVNRGEAWESDWSLQGSEDEDRKKAHKLQLIAAAFCGEFG